MTKTIVLILAFSFAAQAKALTPAEFTTKFVARANEVIVQTNAERKADKKRSIYCGKISPRQTALILKTASIPEITVGAFTSQVTEGLKCYPRFPVPGNPNNLGDTLLNMKALSMDSILVETVIDDLAPSRIVDRAETLLNYPN